MVKDIDFDRVRSNSSILGRHYEAFSFFFQITIRQPLPLLWYINAAISLPGKLAVQWLCLPSIIVILFSRWFEFGRRFWWGWPLWTLKHLLQQKKCIDNERCSWRTISSTTESNPRPLLCLDAYNLFTSSLVLKHQYKKLPCRNVQLLQFTQWPLYYSSSIVN